MSDLRWNNSRGPSPPPHTLKPGKVLPKGDWRGHTRVVIFILFFYALTMYYRKHVKRFHEVHIEMNQT